MIYVCTTYRKCSIKILNFRLYFIIIMVFLFHKWENFLTIHKHTESLFQYIYLHINCNIIINNKYKTVQYINNIFILHFVIFFPIVPPNNGRFIFPLEFPLRKDLLNNGQISIVNIF